MSKIRGVTLVEILIALSILSLVAGALSSGTNYLVRRLVRADNSMIARHLSWQRLERVKSEPIKHGHRSGQFNDSFSNFSFVEEILPAKVNNGILSGVHLFKLTITWKEGYSSEELKLETFIAGELQQEDSKVEKESN
jgi:prepilin-type N-terminal cleavage/methylation domain-containing protein